MIKLASSQSVALLLLVAAAPVLAHEGRPHSYADAMRYWGADPLTMAGLTISAIFYTVGLYRIWSTTAVGKGIRRWEAAVFGIGWLSLFVALVSPVHALSSVLFSVHMTQHEILMLVSAPLMVLGRPVVAFLWAMPVRPRETIADISRNPTVRSAWRKISNPMAAWLIHMVALWIWHLPVLYEAAVGNQYIHFLQHFSFFGSALLFWWALIYGRQGLLGYGAAVLYVFSTAAHSGLLGALLTFAGVVVYPTYAETAPAFGVTALEDQQLGGLIMWIPAGVLYTIAGLALLAGWLREAESMAVREMAKRSRLVEVKNG
ncbi:MAG: cytochrome c oxidase assembly protein [Blastocatellia bacterium]|nr:cytochrome c oxidase assembly protein [Blastocatellia bacterium]